MTCFTRGHVRMVLARFERLAARHTALLFGVAILVSLAVTVTLRDSRGFESRGADGRRWDDLAGYVSWMRLVTLGGVQDAYHGTYLDTYSTYGPVILYGYQVVGNAYRLLVDPEYDRARAEESPWPVRAVKAVAWFWHMLTAGAVYFFVRRTAGAGRAAIAAGLLAANPAALFDIARWGQPDGAHSFFVVMAVGLFTLGWPGVSWAMLALAILAKPQGLILLPPLLTATWMYGRHGAVVRGVTIGAACTCIVLLPFIVTGRLGEVLGLPGTIASVLPAVTANAHNLWWLVLAARGIAEPLAVEDSVRLIGPLSYRSVAAVLVGVQFAFASWLLWTGRARLAEAAALATLGWFLCTTQAHENHLFLVLPLLALAWPERPRLLVIFAILSTTILINMLAGTTAAQITGRLANDPDGRIIAAVRIMNAVTNVVCFGVWAIWAARRVSAPHRYISTHTLAPYGFHQARTESP
jgi:hypothetical protein